MIKPALGAVAAPSPIRIGLMVTLTAIISLALLLAPRLGHAAVTVTDAEVIGRWIVDKNDPGGAYLVAAGPSAGTLRVTVPAKAIGKPVAETLLLQRVAPDSFATAKGASISAKFKVTKPRNAQFSLYRDDKKGVGFVFILLEKQ